MQSKEFCKEVEKYIKSIEKEEIIDFVNNIVRKIPAINYEEVLCAINKDVNMSKDQINEKIREYKKKFEEIEKGSLFFYSEEYKDYSYGWENWKTRYYDISRLGNLIDNAIGFGMELVDYREYLSAKEIFDMVLETNYQVYNETLEEYSDISLLKIRDNKFMSTPISSLCSYIIYITYQISENKAENIYNYFKNYEIFSNESIGKATLLGTEIMRNLDEFCEEWIKALIKQKGETEYHLLQEAFDYIEYKEYEKYIDEITVNQPKIFIDIFNYLKKENKVDELIELGKKALNTIDRKSEVGSDIALYLADIDSKNEGKYLLEAFSFKTYAINLLRITNNGYYNQYEQEIKDIIALKSNENRKNYEDDDEYFYYIDGGTPFLLQFFSGNFEEAFNESIKYKETSWCIYSIQQLIVYLWLLLLDENNSLDRMYYDILLDALVALRFGTKERPFLGYGIEEMWMNWKNNFKIEEELKNKVIKWLNELIESIVDNIMKENYKNYYDEAARLILAYGEMIESQKLGDLDEYVDYFISKYPKCSAFRKGLENLKYECRR